MNPLLGLLGIGVVLKLLGDREKPRRRNPAKKGKRMKEGDSADLFGGWGFQTKEHTGDRKKDLAEARREMKRHGARGLFDQLDRNPGFYTDDEGEVHPIRHTPGYLRSVEAVEQANREDRRLATHYGSHGRDKSEIERPPWGRGLTSGAIQAIAEEYGGNAYEPIWWEKIGLLPGSGELRYALREGSHLGDQRNKSVAREKADLKKREAQALLAGSRAHRKEEQRKQRAALAAERKKLRAHGVRVLHAHEDLPF